MPDDISISNPNSVFDLFMDVHEPLSIFKHLTNLGLNVCRIKLPIADYTYNETAIERKTLEDFLSSAKSYKGKPARLWTQLINMKRNYKNCYVFISGKRRDIFQAFSKEDFVGTVAAVLIGFGIPPITVEDDDELADLIFKVYQRDHKTEKRHRPIPKLRRDAPLEERLENMMAQIESVGYTRAKKLLKRFGSIIGICHASINDLEAIVPPKVARKVDETITYNVKYWDKNEEVSSESTNG